MEKNAKNIFIKKIIVEGFTNLDNTATEVKFNKELKPINFIVGENGTGKTLLMKSIFQIIHSHGKKNIEDITYKKIKIDWNDDNNKERSIIYTQENPIKNIFKLMNDIGTQNQWNMNAVNWKTFVPISYEIDNDKIIKIIKESVYNELKNHPSFKNRSPSSGVINVKNNIYFVNHMRDIYLKIINTLSLKGNNIVIVSEFFSKIILDERDINRQSFLNEAFSKLKEKFKHELKDTELDWFYSELKRLKQLSHNVNWYLTNIFSNKDAEENELLRNNIEFIFWEREVVTFLKRNKISMDMIRNPDAYFDHEKKKGLPHEILVNYNNELNKVISKMSNKLVNSLHNIKSHNTTSNSKIEKFKEMINRSSSKSTKFIRDIFESKEDICKSIQHHIINDVEINEWINDIAKKSKNMDFAIEKINDFLSPTLKAKIKIIDGELKVCPSSSKNPIDKSLSSYKFSSGQNSLISLVTNIILSDKKIYIIDEPELSFSIIWQDKLKELFSKISKNYGKQFIILTHSYFLFDNNKESVCVIPFPS